MIGIQADADGRRDRHLDPVVEPQRRLERHDDLARDVIGVLRRGDVLHHDGELVAAQARHGRPLADRFLQSGGGNPQDAVAGCVAERIVDVLEVVEVQEQHRDPGVFAAGSDDGAREPLGQQRPVGQVGQCIEVGQVAQLLLGAFLVGDIAEYRYHGLGRLPGLADGEEHRRAQEFLAVLAPRPQLARPAPVDQHFGADRGVELAVVLRAVEQVELPADYVGGRVAGDQGEGGVDTDEAEIRVHDAHRFAHVAFHAVGHRMRAHPGLIAELMGDAADAGDPPVRVEGSGAAVRPDPAPATFDLADAQIAHEGIGFALQVRDQTRADQCNVVGMDQAVRLRMALGHQLTALHGIEPHMQAA